MPEIEPVMAGADTVTVGWAPEITNWVVSKFWPFHALTDQVETVAPDGACAVKVTVRAVPGATSAPLVPFVSWISVPTIEAFQVVLGAVAVTGELTTHPVGMAIFADFILSPLALEALLVIVSV